MKVSQLIEELEKLEKDRIIIISKDAEGNSFSPLSSVWKGLYKSDPDREWEGEVSEEVLTKEMREQGFEEEDILQGDDAVSAVILTPVN